MAEIRHLLNKPGTSEPRASEESNQDSNQPEKSRKPAVVKRLRKTQPAARLTGNLANLLVERGIWDKGNTRKTKKPAKGIPGTSKAATKAQRVVTGPPYSSMLELNEEQSMSLRPDDDVEEASMEPELLAMQSVDQLICQYEEDQQTLLNAILPWSASDGCNRAKTWQERESIAQQSWEAHRDEFLKEFIKSQPLEERMCDECHKTKLVDQAIRCLDLGCKSHLCSSCDRDIHTKQVFHRRTLVTEQCIQPLLPTEFMDISWNIITCDVAVPCFVPNVCPSCDENGTLRVIPQTDPSAFVAVITMNGRFDLKLSALSCSQCPFLETASIFHYANAGFRPPLPTVSSYLFSTEVFSFWHHHQHKYPGDSQRKFLEILEEMSKEAGRTATINPAAFTRAYKEWEFQNHRIETEVLIRRKMECPACGPHPLTGSADGNVKLRRLRSAGKARKEGNASYEDPSVPLYGDTAIKSDEAIQELERKIDERVKRSTKKEMCGGSVFKAARSDSSKFHKSDETGVIFTPCRHGVVLSALNMFRGETFIHTLFMHIMCFALGCKFFCNDVICRYWKFVQRVVKAFPEYSGLAKMGRFLPRMHAKAHQWWCQVLYNPHWQKGVGATMGEEHEQVFGHFHVYANTTKRMTAANRNDHLTAGIFYWNRRKFEGMVNTLILRLKRARVRVRSYANQLKLLLSFHSLKISDVPRLWQELVAVAKQCADMRLSYKTELEKLQKNLEGSFVHLRILGIQVGTEAEYCKGRSRMKSSLIQVREKALTTIKLINEKSPEDLQITVDSFDKGDFPWRRLMDQSDTDFPDLSFEEKFKVVDTWMLWCRYKEEVLQTKTEMLQFLRSLETTIKDLGENIASWKSEAAESRQPLFVLGKSLLAGSERNSLIVTIRHALSSFQVESGAPDSVYFDFDQMTSFESPDVVEEENGLDYDSAFENGPEDDTSSELSDLEMEFIDEDDEADCFDDA